MLGYNDPDVTDGGQAPARATASSSRCASELEIEVAERIVELIPCAEMVRFGKNGSDATAGAVRLARASTGRDRVAVLRLSRLAGLVHRRDHAQPRRARRRRAR